MEQYISPELLTASSNTKQPQHSQQHLQQQQLQQTATNLFSSFTSSSDVLAPHPDQFESELDLSLAGFDPLQLQSLIVEQPDAFNFLRPDTSVCGPPSTITVSSESASAYETLSSYSESIYNQASSNYSFPFDLDMDFAHASISAQSDYGSVPASASRNTAPGLAADSRSDYSYEASRHSPSSTGSGSGNISFDEYSQHSPNNNNSVYSNYDSRSEYYPIGSSHPSLAYASNVTPSMSQNHIAPVQPPQARAPSPVGAGLAMSLLPRISRSDNRVPRLHPVSQMSNHQAPARHSQDESIEDPRKKYQCNQCPRAFARAYNLKTHMATHDPLRPKPFVCSHAGCGRSFSRKHDLGRHLVSIHRDESAVNGSAYNDAGSDSGSTSGELRIGVAGMKEGINRCDACGKSGPKKCTCKHDVK